MKGHTEGGASSCTGLMCVESRASSGLARRFGNVAQKSEVVGAVRVESGASSGYT